jgi:hypothetical protein
MKSDQSLPLTEQVGEVQAKTEDRLEHMIVPALDGLFTFITAQVAAAREHLAHLAKR